MRVGGMNNVRLGQAAYDINLTLLLSDYRKKLVCLLKILGKECLLFSEMSDVKGHYVLFLELHSL